jgi:hypothetical protein
MEGPSTATIRLASMSLGNLLLTVGPTPEILDPL